MKRNGISYKIENKLVTFDKRLVLDFRFKVCDKPGHFRLVDSVQMPQGEKSRRTRIYFDTPNGRFSRQGEEVQRLRLTRYEGSDFFIEIKYERKSRGKFEVGKVRVPLMQIRDLSKFFSGEKLKPDFDYPKCHKAIYPEKDLNPDTWEEKREHILREVGENGLVVLASSAYRSL